LIAGIENSAVLGHTSLCTVNNLSWNLFDFANALNLGKMINLPRFNNLFVFFCVRAHLRDAWAISGGSKDN
jgi:hypothetical protein